jgi:hypothetical protein
LLGGFVFLALTDSELAGRQLYFQGGGIGPIMAVVGAVIGLWILIVRKKEIADKEQKL